MESDFSSHDVLSNEKQQTGWYDLPYEMRIMIIEQMDTKTKGKLSSCSKLCCKEVRRSKDFIEYIQLLDFGSGLTLNVAYQKYYSTIEFSKITGNEKEQCLISYESSSKNRDKKFGRTVDGSRKDIALEHFYRFVNDAIHLKKITIYSRRFPFDKTSITHLKKLEWIDIMSNGTIDLLKCGFLTINQLVSTSEVVRIEGTNIEIEQLINFKAKSIELGKVTFSPEQLNQYLKAWNNNKIDESVNSVTILCRLSDVVDLYDFADDIVSDLEVLSRKTRSNVKSFNIKNSAGKMVSVSIRSNMIEVNVKMILVTFSYRN